MLYTFWNMSMQLCKEAYQKLIDEDIEWLLKQPRDVERDHIEAVLKKSVDLLYGKDDSIDENQQGKTTIYQIWCDHTTVSGGFVDGSNYPTQLMFTTLEKARQNKPENDYSTGNSRKYYIKEVEID